MLQALLRLFGMNAWPIWLRTVTCLAPLLCTPAVWAVDSDIDGVPDTTDNCVLLDNPQQFDADGDGWGNRCDADYNNDGIVNAVDLAILRSSFFGSNPVADLNGDGVVNAADLGLFRELFFAPPGPAGFAHWSNASGGEWSHADNWFPAAVPSELAHVRIDLPGTYTVSFGDTAIVLSAAAASVYAEHDVEIRGGDLRVAGSVTSTANVTIEAGVLAVASQLSIDGELAIAGGTLVDATVTSPNPVIVSTRNSGASGVTFASDVVIGNATHLNVTHGLSLVDADIVLASTGNASYLKFNGTQTLDGSGRVVFGGSVPFDSSNWLWQTAQDATLTIASGIRVEMATTGGRIGSDVGGMIVFLGVLEAALSDRRILFGGRFENMGLLHVHSGALLVLQGIWVNHGTILAQDAHFEIRGGDEAPWQNPGQIELTSSSVSVGGAFSEVELQSIVTDTQLTITGKLDNSDGVFDLDDYPLGLLFSIGGGVVGGEVVGSQPLRFDSPLSANVIEPLYLDNVTLSADLEVHNAEVVVSGGLTLNNSEVRILGDPRTITTYNDDAPALNFHGAQVLGGHGEVVFGDADHPTQGLLSLGSDDDMLTIGDGITLRMESSDGKIGRNGGTVVLNGVIIHSRPGAVLRLLGSPFILNSDIRMAADGLVLHIGTPDLAPEQGFVMTDSASLDLPIGPAGPAQLYMRDSGILNGAVNVSFVDGRTPLPCEAIDVLIYAAAPFEGNVGQVNGLDYGGGQLSVRYYIDAMQLVAPGDQCEAELSRLRDATLDASSNEGAAQRVNDESIETAWCAADDDPAPWLTYDWPEPIAVNRLTVGPRFFDSGRLRLFDAADATLFDSGLVDLPFFTNEVVVDGGAQGVSRARFDGVMWETYPCVDEFDVFGAQP